MRDGFREIVTGWQSDGFDALMARIDMAGEWLGQNGGPASFQADEGATASSMMARALRMGLQGAIPKRSVRQ
jgi:hypothetical protein